MNNWSFVINSTFGPCLFLGRAESSNLLISGSVPVATRPILRLSRSPRLPSHCPSIQKTRHCGESKGLRNCILGNGERDRICISYYVTPNTHFLLCPIKGEEFLLNLPRSLLANTGLNGLRPEPEREAQSSLVKGRIFVTC